jgi:hypothetical protein
MSGGRRRAIVSTAAFLHLFHVARLCSPHLGRDDSLLPSQIFLCRRHPAPREKWRRWEVGGPQNPLQGFEVLVAQMRQIRL